MTLITETEEVLFTKKGTIRKRKPKKSNIYFTQETEDAIIAYLASDDQITRNKIFITLLDPSYRIFTFFPLLLTAISL